MPIRINLLAEALAADEERRRDPVKRGTSVGVLIVSVVSLWAATLQCKIIVAKSDLNDLDRKWKAIEKGYNSAVEAQRNNTETDQKLLALHHMTTNRFLWGNTLNAFQQTLGSMDDVQVVRFKAEQVYLTNEGAPSRTNDSRVIPARPPTSTEKISMTIDAMDTSPQPGRRVNQFKESIAQVPFFKDSLTKTNGVMLMSRSAPQNDANGQQTFVMFSLKCSFQEKTR